MHLAKLYRKFDARCNSYYLRAHEIQKLKLSVPRWKYNYLTEVLLSDVWQGWSGFCRELIFSSCRGTKARDGTLIKPRTGDVTWERLGYEAKQAQRGIKTTSNGHRNFYIRNEPTWGDIDSFIKATLALAPANMNYLTSVYGSFTNIKHLQRVRNACAHKNIETLQDISALSSTYKFSKIDYPSDVAWCNVKNNSEFAIELWLYEMNLIADYATSSS